MTHPFSYEGRRVVVTGGSRGVGAALLDVLAELDVSARHRDRHERTGRAARHLRRDRPRRRGARCAPRSLDRGPVHALFNNAGVADTSPPRTVIAVNYLALRTLTEGLLDLHAGGRRGRQHRVDGRQPLAEAGRRRSTSSCRSIWPTGGRRRWSGSTKRAAALDQGPYNFSKEIVERYTLRLARPTDAARASA